MITTNGAYFYNNWGILYYAKKAMFMSKDFRCFTLEAVIVSESLMSNSQWKCMEFVGIDKIDRTNHNNSLYLHAS